MSQNSFHLLFEGLPLPALLLDGELRVLARNAAYRSRYGERDLDPEFLAALSLPPVPSVAAEADSAASPGPSLRRSDWGRDLVALRSLDLEEGRVLILQPDGAPASAAGAAVDAGAAGDLRDLRLRLFVEGAPAALAMFDREMRYVAASRRWREDYGLLDNSLVGKSHYEIFPEIGEEWRDFHRRGLAGESLRREADSFRRGDGSLHWLRWEIGPWYAAQGEIGGILIFSEDISKQKRAEEREKNVSSALRAMHEIALLGNETLDALGYLRRSCAILGEARGYSSVWASLIEGKGPLRLAGQAGLDEAAADLEELVAGEAPPPCCVRALASRGAVEILDTGRDCGACELLGRACGRGALAAALRYGGREYGVIVASAPENFADEEERRLFAEAVELMALSLHAKELERERQRARESLQASERHFRDFFEESALGLAELDQGGGLRRSNRRLEELLGYGRRELGALGFAELLVDPDAGKLLGRLVSSGLSSLNLDTELRRRGGGLLPVNLTLALAGGLESGQARYNLIVSDISERRRAEALAMANQAKFQAAIESSADAILITDDKGRFLEFNEAFAVFHRFPSREACPGKLEAYAELLEVRDEEGRALPVEDWAVSRALRGERRSDLVLELRRRDTGETWVGSYSFAPIRDEAGTLVGTVVATRDVTEHRRTLEVLIDTERRFSRVFNSSPIPIAITRLRDGLILEVNEAHSKFFGYRREELVGSTAARLGLWDSGARERLLDNLATNHHLEGVPMRAHTKSGEIRDILLSVEYFDLNNEPCILGILMDITERRQAEERLSRSLREKETLLRELYHRTKNNMSVIIAMLDLQAAISGNEELTEAFTAAERRIQAMAIVHQKLYEAMDLSRINLASYIRELLEYARQSYSRHPERIAIETKLEEVGILIDSAVPCSLVLNELLSNAFLHAFPDGQGGTLRVELRKEEDGIIEILVADDGVGLPPGYDWRQDGKLGLQTVLNLGAYQLHGDISLASGPGLAWRLRFKDNLYSPRI